MGTIESHSAGNAKVGGKRTRHEGKAKCQNTCSWTEERKRGGRGMGRTVLPEGPSEREKSPKGRSRVLTAAKYRHRF